MDADGTFVVSVGAVDMTGTSSSFASIAAEVLGVPVDRVKVVVPDTDSAPPATVERRDMVTYSVGPAVRAAADAVRDQILQIAASELEIDPGDLEVADGTLSPRGVPSRGIPLTSVAKKTSGFGAPYAPVSASATALPPDLSPSVCVNVAHVKVGSRHRARFRSSTSSAPRTWVTPSILRSARVKCGAPLRVSGGRCSSSLSTMSPDSSSRRPSSTTPYRGWKPCPGSAR